MSKDPRVDWARFDPLLLAALAEPGRSAHSIYLSLRGQGFPGTLHSVQQRLSILGIKLGRRDGDVWELHPELVEQLKRLVAEGCSPTQTAAAMSMTKNQVSGKALRLGLSFHSRWPHSHAQGLPPSVINRIRLLAEQRWTKVRIASSLDLHVNAVYAAGRRYGIEFSSGGHAFDQPDNKARTQKYGPLSLTGRLMGDPPPGRTPWALGA